MLKIITKKSLLKLFHISSPFFDLLLRENREELEKYQYITENMSKRYSAFNYIYTKEFLELWITIFKKKINKFSKVRDELKYEENIEKLKYLINNFEKVSKHDFLIETWQLT